MQAAPERVAPVKPQAKPSETATQLQQPSASACGSLTLHGVGGAERPSISRDRHLAEQVLGLQRRHGNRFVQRIVDRTRSQGGDPQRIDRWETPEHVDIGNVTGRQIDLGQGLVLSQGEMVALAGDYYGSFNEIMGELNSREGRARLRVLIQDKLGRDAGAIGPAGESFSPAELATARAQNEARFRDLALENFSHFVEGGRARGEWLRLHTEAIADAVNAGVSHDAPLLQRAFAKEAFGQHFLTDAFSAGHMRVPRNAIVEHYTAVGTRVTDRIRSYLEERITEGLMNQVETACPNLSPSWTPPGSPWLPEPPGSVLGRAAYAGVVRRIVQGTVREGLGRALSSGGRTLGQTFGLYIGGLVSKILHDQDNAQGLAVVSQARPEGWTAYGDAHLRQDVFGREEAQQAVLAATKDIEDAHAIGVEESVPPVDSVPTVVYFGYNQDNLQPSAQTSLQLVARYMQLDPSTHVDVSGHTDPIGDEGFNRALGMRRAEAVSNYLQERGVAASRIGASSMGESALVSTNPNQYSRNRRVHLAFSLVETNVTTSPAHDNAIRRAGALGPPFSAERYIPSLDPRVQQRPLPEWHWGSMDPAFRDTVNEAAKSLVADKVTEAQTGIRSNPGLQPRSERICGPVPVTLDPGAVASALLAELAANPVRVLEQASGTTASPAGGH